MEELKTKSAQVTKYSFVFAPIKSLLHVLIFSTKKFIFSLIAILIIVGNLSTVFHRKKVIPNYIKLY